jgi:hypothetical protein
VSPPYVCTGSVLFANRPNRFKATSLSDRSTFAQAAARCSVSRAASGRPHLPSPKASRNPVARAHISSAAPIRGGGDRHPAVRARAERACPASADMADEAPTPLRVPSCRCTANDVHDAIGRGGCERHGCRSEWLMFCSDEVLCRRGQVGADRFVWFASRSDSTSRCCLEVRARGPVCTSDRPSKKKKAWW